MFLSWLKNRQNIQRDFRDHGEMKILEEVNSRPSFQISNILKQIFNVFNTKNQNESE